MAMQLTSVQRHSHNQHHHHHHHHNRSEMTASCNRNSIDIHNSKQQHNHNKETTMSWSMDSGCGRFTTGHDDNAEVNFHIEILLFFLIFMFFYL